MLAFIFIKMAFYSSEQWVNWVDQLAENDYIIIDDFLKKPTYSRLINFLSELEENNRLQKAGIGNQSDYQILSEVRGDYIFWLEKNKHKETEELFELLDEVKEQLNQLCFLSLSDQEFHFAVYPPGSSYKKHYDQFKGNNNRMITLIIYLNENWTEENGGELSIESKNLIIAPLERRAVLFKSDRLEHEVLKTNTERRSITGWFLYHPKNVNWAIDTTIL